MVLGLGLLKKQTILVMYVILRTPVSQTCVSHALESEHWRDAMQLEVDSINKNHTWDLVDLPHGKKPIGTKWVFKVKRKQDGSVDRYKARLVAKGYAQKKGVDYDETFAPTSRHAAVCSIVALAAHNGWEVHHLDIKIAFLNGDLHEEIYVNQPEGFEMPDKEHMVCRLRKALYGLKQAPHGAWFEKMHSWLLAHGFMQSTTETTLYVHHIEDATLIISLYVDDLLVTINNMDSIQEFKDRLRVDFDTSDMGLLHTYLGIQFRKIEHGIFMHQGSYARKILQRFGMEKCKPLATPWSRVCIYQMLMLEMILMFIIIVQQRVALSIWQVILGPTFSVPSHSPADLCIGLALHIGQQ